MDPFGLILVAIGKAFRFMSNLNQKKLHPFFDKYLLQAMNVMRVTGVPTSVTLAQAALESNWGKSAPGNNFFGIKGSGPAGYNLLSTTEFSNGKAIKVKQKFRKYFSPEESFIDHARIIMIGPLRNAMKHTESADAFVTALQSGRFKYATDPNYKAKIMKIIKDHNLEIFDT